MLDCLQMGCLPSRSTTVSPAESSGSSESRASKKRNGQVKTSQSSRYIQGAQQENTDIKKQLVDIGTSLDKDNDKSASNSSNGGQEEDIMSILMADKVTGPSSRNGAGPGRRRQDRDKARGETSDESDNKRDSRLEREDDGKETRTGDGVIVSQEENSPSPEKQAEDSRENSFDDELNMDLLKQYITIDYEITQLEDKDALRIYHEKIEQLEQLERELDMISSEAEEVAARSEIDLSQLDRFQSASARDIVHQSDLKGDIESNSLLSGATGSMSPKSSIRDRSQRRGQSQQQLARVPRQPLTTNSSRQASTRIASRHQIIQENNVENVNNQISPATYSTVEEVFNRKIILEKERDKLKKEVELVIIECDKLQHKYKKRDEILDKLFDGRTGNGLENHLEQQLNWLMEQKHYVDQVFYAWKRAETLTSQTCEQFASALDLLKRLPKAEDDEQRKELSKSIAQLLIKSRQDMEQAQRYNPNVDAPFFTDTETERFHKIIETISQSQMISQSEYSQIATVIQFAYKRAVSIRLWLEQILQITIARDSFELAEEYKWIAIQLRKERIILINSKLQEPPYHALAQSIREQLAQQQQQQASETIKSASINNGGNGSNKNEFNRDSGVESDDIDIEDEIYRLLEMNKSRLEAAIAMHQTNRSTNNLAIGMSDGTRSAQSSNISVSQQERDQIMRERVKRRLRGEQSLAIANQHPPQDDTMQRDQSNRSEAQSAATTIGSASTPSKLKVELDETSRQDLLRQVDLIHVKHRNKLEKLRGNNKAKANDLISNRMQQARNPQTIAEDK